MRNSDTYKIPNLSIHRVIFEQLLLKQIMSDILKISRYIGKSSSHVNPSSSVFDAKLMAIHQLNATKKKYVKSVLEPRICKKTLETLPTFPNCKGNHTTNCSKCPALLAFISRRKKIPTAIKPKQLLNCHLSYHIHNNFPCPVFPSTKFSTIPLPLTPLID